MAKAVLPEGDEEREVNIGGLRFKVHVGYRKGLRWRAWLSVHTLRPRRKHKWNQIPHGIGKSVGLHEPAWACSDLCHHHSKDEALTCALERAARVAPALFKHLQAVQKANWRVDRERNRARTQRRAFRQGKAWDKIRLQVLEEEPHCRSCRAASTDVDHIIPFWKGGTNDRVNLQALCGDCHQKKSTSEMRSGLHRAAPMTPPVEGLVTLHEIAARLGVTYPTARRWKTKGLLPQSRTFPGFWGEWWDWAEVQDWAQRTGRLKG